MNTTIKSTPATNKKLGTNNDFRYLYNWEQANHYLQNGVAPVKIDKHYTTSRIFFVFRKDSETDRAYQSWLDSDSTKHHTKVNNV